MGRRVALLIATYDYQDAGLRRLTSPPHDAEALAEVLADPEIAGFEVTTLVNEPHHRVGEAVGDFYRDRRRDDLTLLYFTGHGLKDDGGRLYLAMANTRRESLLFTALSADQLDQAMTGCPSRQKVLILDCCYSGAFPADHLAKADSDVHALERFQGRGRTVLTASDATQYSFEGNTPHGEAPRSVFTHHLVAGLRDGSADLDGDGDITLDELYTYVHDHVVEEMPRQRPKRLDNVEGRMIIARNVNWTLPTYLTNAMRSPIAADRLAALDGLDHLHRIGNPAVRAHVRQALSTLTDDDSKQVSAAAAVRYQALLPTTPAPDSLGASADRTPGPNTRTPPTPDPDNPKTPEPSAPESTAQPAPTVAEEGMSARSASAVAEPERPAPAVTEPEPTARSAPPVAEAETSAQPASEVVEPETTTEHAPALAEPESTAHPAPVVAEEEVSVRPASAVAELEAAAHSAPAVAGPESTAHAAPVVAEAETSARPASAAVESEAVAESAPEPAAQPTSAVAEPDAGTRSTPAFEEQDASARPASAVGEPGPDAGSAPADEGPEAIARPAAGATTPRPDTARPPWRGWVRARAGWLSVAVVGVVVAVVVSIILLPDGEVSDSGAAAVNTRLSAMAINIDGDRLFVTTADPPALKVIDTSTRETIYQQELGTHLDPEVPAGIAVSPDGKQILVAGFRAEDTTSLFTVDGRSEGRIELDGIPAGVAYANWKTAYVITRDPNTLQTIDLASKVALPIHLPFDEEPRDVAVDPRDERVFVASENAVAWVPIDGGDVGQSQTLCGDTVLPTSNGKFWLACRAEGAVRLVDPGNMGVLATVRIESPSDMVLAKERLYVPSESGTVSVIDVETRTVAGEPIPVGARPLAAVADNAGEFVYVANSDRTVSVIDTATNSTEPPLSW